MKAEHRKELETNLLADRMGRLVQRMKTKPQRRTVMTLLLVGAVVVIGLVWWNFIREENVNLTTKHWEAIYRGNRFGDKDEGMDALAGIHWAFAKGSDKGLIRQLDYSLRQTEFDKPGKAIRLEVARYCLWDLGVRKLARPFQPEQFEQPSKEGIVRILGLTPLERLDLAAHIYEELKTRCENEPEWKAEALYGLAVIEETRALQNIKLLAKAKDKYKSLAKDLPDTGHGKLAEKRFKELDTRFDEVTRFYEELNKELNLPPLILKSSKLGDIR